MNKLSMLTMTLVITLAGHTGAEGLRDRPFDLSLSVGAAFPGIIMASFEKDFSPDRTVAFVNRLSPGFKLVADYFPRAIPSLGPSIAFHYAPLFLPDDYDLGYWDGRDHIVPKEGIHFVEVEGGIKYRAFINEYWTVEPGLFFGYCHTFSSSPDAVNNGFIVDVNTEIQRHYRLFHILVTLGFMTQRYGGVEDLAYIKSLPVGYMTVGAGL